MVVSHGAFVIASAVRLTAVRPPIPAPAMHILKSWILFSCIAKGKWSE